MSAHEPGFDFTAPAKPANRANEDRLEGKVPQFSQSPSLDGRPLTPDESTLADALIVARLIDADQQAPIEVIRNRAAEAGVVGKRWPRALVALPERFDRGAARTGGPSGGHSEEK